MIDGLICVCVSVHFMILCISCRPSIQLDTSIHTLLQALTSDVSGLTSQASTLGPPSNSPPPTTSHTSALESSSSLRSCSETPISSSTETAERTGIEELKELVGKLELNNVSLTTKFQKQLQTKSSLEASVMESKSVCADLTEKLDKSEATITSLKEQLVNMAAQKEIEANGVEELKHANTELAEKLSALEDERENVGLDLERVRQDHSRLEWERNQLVGELNEMRTRLAQREDEKGALAISVEGLARENEQLKNSIDEMRVKMNDLEDSLSEAAEEKMEWMQDKEKTSEKMKELKTQRNGNLKELAELKEKLEEVEARHVQDVDNLKKSCFQLEEDLVSLRENQLVQKNKELEEIVLEKQQLSSLAETLTVDKKTLNFELLELRQKLSTEQAKLSNELALSVEESKTLRDALTKREHELASVHAKLTENKNTNSRERQEIEMELETSRSEVQKLGEELVREQQRHVQAQTSLKSANTKVETLTMKGKDVSLKLEEKHYKNQELSLQVQRTTQNLSDKNSELLALRSEFEAEIREVNVKKEAEMKKAAGAEAKSRTVENMLNQKEGELNGCKDKLTVAEKRVEELELEVERKKEHILSIFGKSDQGDGAALLRTEVEEKNKKIRRLQEELDSCVQNFRGEINGAHREVEDSKRAWNEEKDLLLMQNMELERDIKELRRNQEGGGGGGGSSAVDGGAGACGGSAGNEPPNLTLERGELSSSFTSTSIPSSGLCVTELMGGVAIHR